MKKEELKTELISKARFEFRTFGQNFDKQAYRMARLSIPVPENLWERQSDEIYIVSQNNNINNAKIRDGKIDIKTFVQAKDGLEQWCPVMKGKFPIEAKILKEEIWPTFQVDLATFEKDTYTLREFINLIDTKPNLQAVRVHKHRFAYMVNNTICEFAEVLINGAKVLTINSESTEIDDIKKTLKDVGLEGMENINYLQAIKRVIGMINKPL